MREGYHQGSQPKTTLTAREREVAQLVATGARLPDIARQLGVSPRTAEAHARSIREKTNTGSLFELGLKLATGRIVIDDPDKTD